MSSCPKCGSDNFQRSRARTTLEQFRKRLTRKRLHRCTACGWRGWVFEIGPTESQQPHDRLVRDVAPPDLQKLDRALSPRRRSQRTGGRRE